MICKRCEKLLKFCKCPGKKTPDGQYGHSPAWSYIAEDKIIEPDWQNPYRSKVDKSGTVMIFAGVDARKNARFTFTALMMKIMRTYGSFDIACPSFVGPFILFVFVPTNRASVYGWKQKKIVIEHYHGRKTVYSSPEKKLIWDEKTKFPNPHHWYGPFIQYKPGPTSSVFDAPHYRKETTFASGGVQIVPSVPPNLYKTVWYFKTTIFWVKTKNEIPLHDVFWQVILKRKGSQIEITLQEGWYYEGSNWD